MSNRTLLIVGATSIIAREYAKLAARANNNLILAGRNEKELAIIASDLNLRFKISVKIIVFNAEDSLNTLLDIIKNVPCELDLMLTQSLMTHNNALDENKIKSLITVNVTSLSQIVHCYWLREQKQKNILFISSVAVCRGRAKNSLYAGTKLALELYLQGLTQKALQNECITIARLGFIDTKATFGQEGIFYAAPPEKCAQALWHATQNNKKLIYYPYFWRFIMLAIKLLPIVVFKKMKF